MRVAIDAMGGDNAPDEIVLGAVQAAREFGCELVLVGDETKILQVWHTFLIGKALVLPFSTPAKLLKCQSIPARQFEKRRIRRWL